jgi:hypothetical protein
MTALSSLAIDIDSDASELAGRRSPLEGADRQFWRARIAARQPSYRFLGSADQVLKICV